MNSLRQAVTSWSDRHPYVSSLAMIAAVTIVGFASTPFLRLRPSNIDVVYLLVVLISALRWGRTCAIVTAIVSVIVFDFCFIPPQFTFGVSDLPYLINLFAFLIVAVATSVLAAGARALAIEQAARAQAEARGQAKDDILRHISHELRSPLNAIRGWAQLLERPNLEPQRFGRALSGVQDGAALLGRLIDDLLSACRVTSGRLSIERCPTALAPIVSAAVDAAALAAAEKGVHIESAIPEVGDVFGDGQRVEQIVINLLSNAIKFTPNGGQVSVRLGRAGEQAELVVRDTGVGIPKEFLPHIFEPFSQADRRHATSGLGLGLSIVKYLVDAHGGDIGVESTGPGSGATFTVHLPLLDRPAARQDVASSRIIH